MSSLRTLSFMSEYKAAIVEVCGSRTLRVIEMSRTKWVMQLSWTLYGHYPLSQSTKQPLWRYVCHELSESPKRHNFFTYVILSLSPIQSSLSGGTCVTNFELHKSPKCHKVFTYTILCLRYGAALVIVCVLRTERVTEMSQSLYVHEPLSQCRGSHCGGMGWLRLVGSIS